MFLEQKHGYLKIGWNNSCFVSRTRLCLLSKRLFRLNKIRTVFSIKDLERLSGIKAHTIRMWEKRHCILVPDRSHSNIRLYTLENLQKLLNVSLLYNSGLKISKIADLTILEIQDMVHKRTEKKGDKDHFLNELKIAMLGYDQLKFELIYNRLVVEMSFKEIFLDVFIPFLEYIGFHWQTNSITPAHENFVTSLIYQKLLINIERIKKINLNPTDIYVLFLPEEEIHDLGLLYIAYELHLARKQIVYLGTGVPINSLLSVLECHPTAKFVSYFTVYPSEKEVNAYLKEIDCTLLSKHNSNFYVFGRLAHKANYPSLRIKVFNNTKEGLNKMC